MSLRAICPVACGGGGDYRPDLGLTGSAAWTKKVLISNNLFNTSSYTGIHAMATGPTPETTLEDAIIENNFFKNASGGGAAISLSRTNKITVRNNIVNLGTFGTAISAVVVPHAGASDIFVYNNAIFSGGDSLFGLSTDDLLSNVVMRNNVLYAPNAGLWSKAAIGPGAVVSTTVAASNNTTNGAQIITAPGPSFTNSSGSLSLPSDFRLAPGSYAIGKGLSVPVFMDFFGVLTRPQGAGVDMGATEQ